MSTYLALGEKLFSIIAMAVIVPFMSKVLKISEPLLVLVALVSIFSSIIVILLAKVPELLYLSSAFGMFDDAVTIGLRVALTKVTQAKRFRL
jgi:hypothetical protein